MKYIVLAFIMFISLPLAAIKLPICLAHMPVRMRIKQLRKLEGFIARYSDVKDLEEIEYLKLFEARRQSALLRAALSKKVHSDVLQVISLTRKK